jgi:hypothetical protein
VTFQQSTNFFSLRFITILNPMDMYGYLHPYVLATPLLRICIGYAPTSVTAEGRFERPAAPALRPPLPSGKL